MAQLPAGITPAISPQSPTGEIFRYVLTNPKDAAGREIYNLNDLKSLQDFTLERLFRRLPGVADVCSFGGTVKRYEIHPDPARMQRYGITLQQHQGRGFFQQLECGRRIRHRGRYGPRGALSGTDRLRPGPHGNRHGDEGPGRRPRLSAERRRTPASGKSARSCSTATNNVPVRVDDVVEGGPLREGDPVDRQGVVVGWQTRLGHVQRSYPLLDAQGKEVLDAQGRRVWHDDPDVVQCICLLRKGDQSLPVLAEVQGPGQAVERVAGPPAAGREDPALLRSHRPDPRHDRHRAGKPAGRHGAGDAGAVHVPHQRAGALIVAINIPLALLFAFAVLFLRGKSANLLSIGAVDFGIIVDSSVIIVENIYRHLSSGLHAELPIGRRIILASNEIQHCLFYSTAIMICAFLPLFAMSGPEGQIFGPMAETYAFALGGALLSGAGPFPRALHVFPQGPQAHARQLPGAGLASQLLAAVAALHGPSLADPGLFRRGRGGTAAALQFLGGEFMPELEEGNIWVQAQFPLNSSLEEVCALSQKAHEIMKRYPETEMVLTQVGRPDDGTDPAGFYNAEFFMPLKPQSQWPIPPGRSRPRTKEELTDELSRELKGTILSVEWNFSQNIRNMVMESMSGVRGENSVKIIGPDLEELERAADRVVKAMRTDPGTGRRRRATGSWASRTLCCPSTGGSARGGTSRWATCRRSGETAVGGKPFSQMIEGERSFDITLRFPKEQPLGPRRHPQDSRRRGRKHGRLQPSSRAVCDAGERRRTAGPRRPARSANLPSLTGSAMNATMNDLSRTPRRRLGDMVTPLGPDGKPNPGGSFFQRGASDIYRDQGERLIAIKFDIHGRDLAGAVAEAQQKMQEPGRRSVRLEWTGEFQEMEQAERRLMIVIPLAAGLVMVLLYLAFRSFTDVFLVLSNVVTMVCGGIWALLLTHTNFSISAAVGFISIFGVAVMDGLLQVSSFHRLAARRPAHGRGDPARLAGPAAADDDDRVDGRLRAAAGGVFHAHRRPDATPAGNRRDRRNVGGAVA